ncbi:MAG TPA: DUF917 domain-containing protein [Thermoplasmata archaeon]|nr:DUF917 domain-containing protein [Thermoplasmata archaeon]
MANRILNNEGDIRDFIRGCTVLGTGGGGSPEEGLKIIEKEFKRGKNFLLISVDELPNDAAIASPYCVGSLKSKRVISVYNRAERGFPVAECIRSFGLLEEYTHKKFFATIATEIGGGNTAIAFAVAARSEIPIIDGDLAGRSVPECQQTTFCIKNLEMTPFSIVTPYGDEIIVPRVKDDFEGEKVMRGMVTATGANVGVTSHPRVGKEVRDSVVKGSITFALKIGRALKNKNPVDSLVESGGILLFRGVATKASWKDKGGFTPGEFELRGIEEFEKEAYKVSFKNENLISWRNEKVDVTIPDLICTLTPEGKPVINPNVRKGKEYVIVGFRAPKIWRTSKGLELFGPKYLGLDSKYIPVGNRRM